MSKKATPLWVVCLPVSEFESFSYYKVQIHILTEFLLSPFNTGKFQYLQCFFIQVI